MSATRTLQVTLGLGIVFPIAAALLAPETVHRAWLVATVLVEVACLLLTLQVRGGFDPEDPGRRTWNLILGFFTLRLLAELRLVTLYFDWIPGFITESAELSNFYSVTLRYLYTTADVVLIVALLGLLRSYRGLGLQFRIRPPDWIVVAVLALMPGLVFVMRDNLGGFLTTDDPALVAYRMVAVIVGVVVAIMSLGVLRYVTQMGGGALARIWGAIGIAGVARATSFVLLALLSGQSDVLGDLAEQGLLWVFASCWLAAILWQRELAAE